MKRYVFLDLIRVIAISLLLTAHIGQALNHPIGGFFGIEGFYYVSLGGFAVTIFLILSGMVLELQYSSKTEYLNFLTKRILRIYPIYYLALLFGIILYLSRSYRDGLTFYSAVSQFGIGDIFLCIAGGYAFAGKWGGPFLATSWFIGLIMSMYLIYPVISKAIRKKPILTLCLTIIISSISRILLGNFELLPGRPLDWFPLCRIFEFSLGVFMANSIKNEYFKILDGINHLTVKTIIFISGLSFPLFLIHYLFCSTINLLVLRGVSKSLSILCFLFISGFTSYIALNIDKLIPRQQLIPEFFNRNKIA